MCIWFCCRSVVSIVCPCCCCVAGLANLAMFLIKLPVKTMKWFTDQIPCWSRNMWEIFRIEEVHCRFLTELFVLDSLENSWFVITLFDYSSSPVLIERLEHFFLCRRLCSFPWSIGLYGSADIHDSMILDLDQYFKWELANDDLNQIIFLYFFFQ